MKCPKCKLNSLDKRKRCLYQYCKSNALEGWVFDGGFHQVKIYREGLKKNKKDFK